MPAENVAFVGSIPENYDRYLGPVLFEPYAQDLVERVNAPEGGRLLEIACGTGIVTRHLRDRLPPSVKIVATDLNEAMISYARQKFRADENVEWKPADALDLPFGDESFDAIVCQFGLMFFPDKQRGVSEAFRVLKPDGQYTFSVWDAIERVDLAKATETVIKQFFPENPPDFYDIPFSFHDQDRLRSVLTTASFREITIEAVPFPCVSASARDVAHGLIHGNPVISAINERDPAKAPKIEAALAEKIAAQFGAAPVKAHMQAIVCTAVR
ncbi:MAG: class I SAM-dependent methyltransferase [Acidobacteriota bacterium]